MQRALRPLGYLVDFSRLNRRMHNKSIHRRRRGDDRRRAQHRRRVFRGRRRPRLRRPRPRGGRPGGSAVAKSFDDYWRSDSPIRSSGCCRRPPRPRSRPSRSRGESLRAEPRAARYLDKVATTRVMRDLVAQELPFEWAASRLVVDDPAKGLGKAGTRAAAAGTPRPTRSAARRRASSRSSRRTSCRAARHEALSAVRSRREGEDPDQRARVDRRERRACGYAKRRRDLLRAGVRISEINPRR